MMEAFAGLLFNKRSLVQKDGKFDSVVLASFSFSCSQSLVIDKPDEFMHILRIQNTNVSGKHKVMFALRSIKGIGRRFSNLICKIAQVDLDKR